MKLSSTTFSVTNKTSSITMLLHLCRVSSASCIHQRSRWPCCTAVRLIHQTSTIMQIKYMPSKCNAPLAKSSTRTSLQNIVLSDILKNGNTKMFCTRNSSSTINLLKKQKQFFQQHSRPISIPTKALCSSHSQDLGAEKVFSSEVREEMAARISQIRVPRRLFKKIKKHAGVLVPLCTVGGEPAVLLTLRSTNLSSHRGEVSFPGGIQDDSDADIIATALRETEEELGIKAETVDVWCQLPAVPNKMRDTAVVSVVGFVGETDVNKLKLNRNEVECAFTIPLATLLDPVNQKYTKFSPPKDKNLVAAYTLPVFLGGPYRVWGLSAIIMDAVLQAWLPQSYTSLIKRLKLFGQE